jgi:hypothetical protein
MKLSLQRMTYWTVFGGSLLTHMLTAQMSFANPVQIEFNPSILRNSRKTSYRTSKRGGTYPTNWCAKYAYLSRQFYHLLDRKFAGNYSHAFGTIYGGYDNEVCQRNVRACVAATSTARSVSSTFQVRRPV